MTTETIQQILIRRDNLTVEQADQIIAEAKEQFQYYLSCGDTEEAYNICQEYFNLEPDYIGQLIP